MPEVRPPSRRGRRGRMRHADLRGSRRGEDQRLPPVRPQHRIQRREGSVHRFRRAVRRPHLAGFLGDGGCRQERADIPGAQLRGAVRPHRQGGETGFRGDDNRSDHRFPDDVLPPEIRRTIGQERFHQADRGSSGDGQEIRHRRAGDIPGLQQYERRRGVPRRACPPSQRENDNPPRQRLRRQARGGNNEAPEPPRREVGAVQDHGDGNRRYPIRIPCLWRIPPGRP